MPRLPTSAQRLTDPLIQAARVHWGLGDASITLIAARENSVFRVDRPNGPTALRLHRKGYRSVGELRSELQWMDMLAGNGVHVPAPVPALDGSNLLLKDGIVVDMLSWLEGAPLTSASPNPKIYFDLGLLVAQMQNCADAWHPPQDFTRPTWDLIGDDPSWGQFWENPLLTPQERDIFLSFRDHARGVLTQLGTPDIGLIHADLVPDNVILFKDRLQPIDFDDGGFGYRLFDLATITFRSRRTDPSGALANAVIEGYQICRPRDLGSLPFFEALRACTYVGWNITRMDEEGGADRNARFITAAIHAIRSIIPR